MRDVDLAQSLIYYLKEISFPFLANIFLRKDGV